MEPISADIGQSAEYTLDRWPVNYRADQTLRQLFTPTGNLEAPINPSFVSLWEITRRNQRGDKENNFKPHRKLQIFSIVAVIFLSLSSIVMFRTDLFLYYFY